MPYHVYILRLENHHIYVGSTSDLHRRLAEHQRGSGCKTTADSSPAGLFYSEAFLDHPSAVQRERQIKRWSHAKKLALVNGDQTELKRLARCRSATPF